jgi:hypothetical protein
MKTNIWFTNYIQIIWSTRIINTHMYSLVFQINKWHRRILLIHPSRTPFNHTYTQHRQIAWIENHIKLPGRIKLGSRVCCPRAWDFCRARDARGATSMEGCDLYTYLNVHFIDLIFNESRGAGQRGLTRVLWRRELGLRRSRWSSLRYFIEHLASVADIGLPQRAAAQTEIESGEQRWLGSWASSMVGPRRTGEARTQVLRQPAPWQGRRWLATRRTERREQRRPDLGRGELSDDVENWTGARQAAPTASAVADGQRNTGEAPWETSRGWCPSFWRGGWCPGAEMERAGVFWRP